MKVSHSDLLDICTELWEKNKNFNNSLAELLIAYAPSALMRYRDKNQLGESISDKSSDIDRDKKKINEGRKHLFKCSIRFPYRAFACRVKALIRGQKIQHTNKIAIVWQEYYKNPNIDDMPFIDGLNNNGYQMYYPENFYGNSFSVLLSNFNSLYQYGQAVELVSELIVNYFDKYDFKTKSALKSMIKASLWQPRTITRVLKASCYDKYHLHKIIDCHSKVVVVYRHFGDLALAYLCRQKLGIDRKNIKQVILHHAATAPKLPLTIQYAFPDIIVPKTVAGESTIIDSWPSKAKELLGPAVGDPRAQVLTNKRIKNCKREKVIIAFSDGGVLGRMDDWSDLELRNLTKLVDCIQSLGYEVILKTKLSPGQSVDLAMSKLERIQKKYILPLSSFIDSTDIAWCVQHSVFAVVIGSPLNQRISSVLEDFVQCNVPTALLMINDTQIDKKIPFANALPEYHHIFYSSKDFVEKVQIKKNKIIDELSAGVNKLNEENPRQLDSQSRFLNIINNLFSESSSEKAK